MPGATGVVQDAGVPLRPSISTRHRRQEPKLFTESVAQSFGILVPSSIAARMIDVPSGTVTSWPSISSVTIFVASDFAVPKSISFMSILMFLFRRQFLFLRQSEILWEFCERTHHRIGRQPTHGAERTIRHCHTQFFQKCGVGGAVHSRDNFVDHFNASDRANAAGRAFATRFNGAEFHCKARLLGHIH